MKTYRIGLIGLGGMAHSHLNWINELGRFEIVAISDVNSSALEQFGNQLNIDSSKRFINYEQLIVDPDVEAVVSVTPNHIHADIMSACIVAGKPFLGEKPFTRTLEEAQQVLALYEKNPISTMIGFSYRYTPAFRYMRELIKQGKVGAVHSFSIQYLQSWGTASQPYIWRFDKAITGTGTLGDLGSHMIDMARFLFGEFEELSAQMKTIIPERLNVATNQMVPIEVDDFASFQARMTDGVMGIFQTSRNAVGSGNQHEVSLYGDIGTLHASTVNPDQLIWIKEESPGQLVKQTLDVPQQYKLRQYEQFASLLDGTADETIPTLLDGFRNQQVLEAIIKSSNEKLIIQL
ncbi:MAG TPA: Gfo/Idh/MocA family oxidoreductase [Candidatus Paenibacillus intestinavium]|nr:Gfo/Idh/MocA family oxidoreductase [Candidatus Paenibacillus intestinavium]